MEGIIQKNSGLGAFLSGLGNRDFKQDLQPSPSPAVLDQTNTEGNSDQPKPSETPSSEDVTPPDVKDDFKEDPGQVEPEHVDAVPQEEISTKEKEAKEESAAAPDKTPGGQEPKAVEEPKAVTDYSSSQKNQSNETAPAAEDDSDDKLDWRAKIDTSNMTKKERALLGNMTYEEETELRKNTSIGAILSGLSTGSYGSKAKENIVKVQSSGKRYWNNPRYDTNKRFRFDDYGGNWGGGNFYDWSYQEEEPVVENYGKFNDDWVKEENRLLEAEFGPGMISLLCDEDNSMIYICEICQAQMNNRKSLDVHLNGMKHLKRKNVLVKKRRLEGYEKLIGDDKTEGEKKSDDPSATTKPPEESKKVEEPIPSINKGPGGYPNQPPPPYGPMVGMPGQYKQPNQWGGIGTGVPPPPSIVTHTETKPQTVTAPPVEEKPKVKSNLSGGATGTLLQKLAACAVKNFKDSDLATNVIIALVKTMKDYNHARGDTKSIEALTEIDIKLRGLKAQMPPPDADKKVASSTAKPAASKTSSTKLINEHSANKPPVVSDASKTTAYNYYSSTGSAQSGDGSGTWYSQGKGDAIGSVTSYPTMAKKETTPTAGYALQDPGKTSVGGYMSQPKSSSNYASYPYNQNHPTATDTSSYSAKPSENYYSQPPYNSYPGQAAPAAPSAVIDIINTTAPPPPPPSDVNAGYGTQSYSVAGYQGGYAGYYNT